MRRTSTILIIVCIAALAAGAYTYSRASSKVPVVPAEKPAVTSQSGTIGATISYTDKGFVPSEAHIKPGQIVRFVNAAKAETWPASSVHPTHSVYPQHASGDCLGSSFDACRGLKPSESWEFQFDYAGEWRFHDHIHPTDTGIIHVK